MEIDIKQREPLPGCQVAGCDERPVILVSGDRRSAIFMCSRHAATWVATVDDWYDATSPPPPLCERPGA